MKYQMRQYSNRLRTKKQNVKSRSRVVGVSVCRVVVCVFLGRVVVFKCRC